MSVEPYITIRNASKLKINIHMLRAAETMFANANRIPSGAPNSRPIDREIMK